MLTGYTLVFLLQRMSADKARTPKQWQIGISFRYENDARENVIIRGTLIIISLFAHIETCLYQ